MAQIDLMDIAKLSLCVGFLGESHQNAWWQSSFLSSDSIPFLSPVFGKTYFQAQYSGVKEAAAKIHDMHIGIGKGVFHLFRLPENIESDMIEMLLIKENEIILLKFISNVQSSEKFLQDYAKKSIPNNVGPVRLGSINEIEIKAVWQTAAQYYLTAFKNGTRIFPYFSGDE